MSRNGRANDILNDWKDGIDPDYFAADSQTILGLIEACDTTFRDKDRARIAELESQLAAVQEYTDHGFVTLAAFDQAVAERDAVRQQKADLEAIIAKQEHELDEAKSRLWLTWNYRNSPAIKGTTFEEWCAVLDSDAARMSELMQPYDQPVATDFL